MMRTHWLALSCALAFAACGPTAPDPAIPDPVVPGPSAPVPLPAAHSTAEAALPLVVGTPASGMLDAATPQHYYRFTADAAKASSFLLQGQSAYEGGGGVAAKLTVLDGAQNKLAGVPKAVYEKVDWDSAELSHTAKTTGEYYIRVSCDCRGDKRMRYRLTWQ